VTSSPTQSGVATATTLGTIYLLHYTKPVRGRRHYLGWSEDPVGRWDRHRRGRGALETRRAVEAGAQFVQAQTWKGTPALEARIKDWSNRHAAGYAGLCPICDRGLRLPPGLEAELGPGSMRIYHAAAA
jgi:predicted GIY-YIG superfamily endonuclease